MGIGLVTPWLQDPDVTLYHGDVLATLRELPAGTVDCVVTSPPYWGLRDYGQEGQLGLEPTPEQYVEHMVEVFREVRRVLAVYGTVWLNLGDTYAEAPSYQVRDNKHTEVGNNMASEIPSGLKQKDLVGIPWRVAFALQADGWYLRSDIIWSKPNPMPESVTDRPTKAHEYVFLLSKQPRYFFDAEAVREPFLARPQQRLTPTIEQPLGPARVAAGVQQGNVQGGTHVSRFTVQAETLRVEDEDCGCIEAGCGRTFYPSDCGCACHLPAEAPRGPDGRRKTTVRAADGSIQHRDGERWPNGGRNIRSVWEIATQPYPEAHFATFPEELARRCIAAGCPEQVCRMCGKARERLTRTEIDGDRPKARQNIIPTEVTKAGQGTNAQGSSTWGHYLKTETLGFTDCGHDDYRPGVVLDPFIGSGTVAYVARKLGRHAIGIDLNESYLELAARRLQQQSLLTEIA